MIESLILDSLVITIKILKSLKAKLLLERVYSFQSTDGDVDLSLFGVSYSTNGDQYE